MIRSAEFAVPGLSINAPEKNIDVPVIRPAIKSTPEVDPNTQFAQEVVIWMSGEKPNTKVLKVSDTMAIPVGTEFPVSEPKPLPEYPSHFSQHAPAEILQAIKDHAAQQGLEDIANSK